MVFYCNAADARHNQLQRIGTLPTAAVSGTTIQNFRNVPKADTRINQIHRVVASAKPTEPAQSISTNVPKPEASRRIVQKIVTGTKAVISTATIQSVRTVPKTDARASADSQTFWVPVESGQVVPESSTAPSTLPTPASTTTYTIFQLV